ALDRDPGFRVGEGRGEEHRGRVADRVAGLVRDYVPFELALSVPRTPVLAGGPAGEARDDLAAGLVLRPDGHDVGAAARRGEAAGHRVRPGDQRTARHGG